MESIAGTDKRQYILILKCLDRFLVLFSSKGSEHLQPFVLFAETALRLWVGDEAARHAAAATPKVSRDLKHDEDQCCSHAPWIRWLEWAHHLVTVPVITVLM